jgi:hypothetical protein
VSAPQLDRLPEFDERSRSYPIRGLVPQTPRSFTWRCDTWLDQGTEGACVGHGWAHEAAARPVPRQVTSADAMAIYRRARQLDQWPGEDYSGTSVIAGAKATKERGWLREYRWGFSLNDALTAISRHGPCVLGLDWWTGMFAPDLNGQVHVTGRLEGGHCILAVGVNVKRRTVTLHNSWGHGWGVGGRCFISWDDLGGLLADGGECAVPVLR